jgi:hypothetical protein
MKKAKSLVQDIKNALANARQIKAASGIPGLARRSIAFAYRRGVRPWLPVQQVIHYRNQVRPQGRPIETDPRFRHRPVAPFPIVNGKAGAGRTGPRSPPGPKTKVDFATTA